ncbi:hypothetical protein GFK91_06165 [Roseibium aggregatum]|uniref:Cthe_2314 family HEPN domain-containing protein n=1 Tax=Roseibium aggregatum TaxID=187304 RepID=UPI001E4F2FB4|nr:Cthe_2314 family HEPN domain-containing protein [Roseibium aggregatum]UES55225.1 hypothetical protein GFK91_06165 [Roseibium aggregatum]
MQRAGEKVRKRPRTKFLKRHFLVSDHHDFIGRVYGLSIVGLNFDSYTEVEKYPDCKYALDTYYWVRSLVQRIESLNLVGNMLWPDPYPESFERFPISGYDWLRVSTDVFLVRYVSVVDCALLLVNEIFCAGLKQRDCTFRKLKKHGIPGALSNHLQNMLNEQESWRFERNSRVHHGEEREFTDDDMSFRMASNLGMVGHDRYGRKLNADRSFKEGLVGLQRDFNHSTRLLLRQLNPLYDMLWDEFEAHLGPLMAAATHGFNAGAHHAQ